MIAFDSDILEPYRSECYKYFSELCPPNNTDDINDLIYEFALLRYTQMRGRWFVKSIQVD